MDGDIPLWYASGIFIVCTVYALLLTGADAAFSNLPKATFQKHHEDREHHENRDGAQAGSRWLDNQERLFATLVAGKSVMLVGVVVSASTLLLDAPMVVSLGLTWSRIATGVVLAIYLITIIEWLPRNLVARNEALAARIALPMAQATYYVLWPVIRPILILTRRTNGQGLFSSGRNPHWFDEELYRVLELEETHELQADEKEMISSIIEMHETSVREIMIPRVDMVCADVNTEFPALLELIREMGHSRIPIFRGSIDHIIGVIFAKDLLKDEDIPQETISVENLARAPYFVPETKRVDELLREFQQEKIHLGIVVDEYGVTAGLITMEDLIEEIIGEIQDEYDVAPTVNETLADGSILVDAKLNIDELNEMMGTEIVPDGFETIAGLVFDAVDRVPEVGEILEYRELRIVVREVDGQRIVKVSVSRIDPVVNEEDRGK